MMTTENLQVCGACDHPVGDHAFFPSGEPAPLCVAEYLPDDVALLDHNCECEGFQWFKPLTSAVGHRCPVEHIADCEICATRIP